MSGFAVVKRTQPHLINNIIVLLHTAVRTQPPTPSALSSFPFFSFYFRLWQRAVLWHCWTGVTPPPCTETKHNSRARGSALLLLTGRNEMKTEPKKKKKKKTLKCQTVCLNKHNKWFVRLQQVQMNLLLSQLLSGAWISLRGVCVDVCMYSKPEPECKFSLLILTLITVFCVFFFSLFVT